MCLKHRNMPRRCLKSMLPLSQWGKRRSSSTCMTQLVRFLVTYQYSSVMSNRCQRRSLASVRNTSTQLSEGGTTGFQYSGVHSVGKLTLMDTAEVIKGNDVRADLHPAALRCDDKDICSFATKEYLIKCANMTHTQHEDLCRPSWESVFWAA